ncbi:hypothetical protein [Cellvibrio sp. NN19]|uniref:hypothetical protein n=1 Tax=Cellvibrio chitinivorans TaxID=3102792 RepID=UPI002B40B6FF|nr:hypothetical protein [Cellvibrio sp. NN19]
MTPEQFVEKVERSYQYSVKYNAELTLENELERIYQSEWYNWNIVSLYIEHPLASLERIAEIWRFAPAFVESHPLWPTLSSNGDWPKFAQQAQRDLLSVNSNRWGRLPAFYVGQLFAQQDVKSIIRILDSDYVDKRFCERWSSQLLALDNHSINLRLIRFKGFFPLVKAELLTCFSKSKSANVRLAVARHDLTRKDVLVELCSDSDEKVAKAALENPRFPQEAMGLIVQQEEQKLSSKLDNLAGLAWKEIGDFLLHPDFPAEGLEILFEQEDAAVRFACAMHPNASEILRTKILEQEEVWMKAAVALNPNAPESVLRELALIDDFDIAFALVSNPNLPDDLQLAFANHPNRIIRLHLADRTNSFAVLAAVAAHPTPEGTHTGIEQLLALAISPKTSAAKLGALQTPTHISRSNGEALSTSISNAIAAHANFPDKLIGRYRYYNWPQLEKNKIIQLRVLEGLSLPEPEPVPGWKFNGPAILRFPGYVANHLLLSSDITILRMACAHIGCDKKLLFPLWHTQDTLILKKLAQREDLPRFFYEILWLHGGDPVRVVLKSNKEALSRGVSFANKEGAPRINIKMKKSPTGEDSKVVVSGVKKDRMELAKTSNEEAVLRALATDKLKEVRAQLLYQDSLPWSVIEILAKDTEVDIRRNLPDFLLEFPLEQTLSIEKSLFQEGGEVAKNVARRTRNEDIQREAVKDYADRMVHNDFLAPIVLDYYLHNGTIEQLLKIAENIENQPGFSIKVADLLFHIIEHHHNDPIAGICVLYPDSSQEEKNQYQLRLVQFLAEKGKRIEDIGFNAQSIMGKFLEHEDAQKIILRVLSNTSSSLGNRLWAISVCSVMTDATITALAKGSLDEKKALAKNPHISSAIINLLIVDSEHKVRRNIAQYHASSAAQLVADENEDVRCTLAELTVDIKVQRHILNDPSANVLSALADNIHCDSDVLAGLIQKNKSYDVRRNAVNNSNITNEMLIFLLKDRNSYIRDSAKKKLESRGIESFLQ